MRYLKTDRLSCFSPPVMIATFVIEIGLAIYVGVKYQWSRVTKLTIAILFFLALFQLAEYNVCEGSFGVDGLSWARLGYVAITALPPLGLHLAMEIAGKKRKTLLTAAYITGVCFAGFFLFSGQGLVSQACMGNYVIFETTPQAANYYALYYYGWLLVGVTYSLYFARNIKQNNISKALHILALGYAAFIVPTTLVNIVDPSTIDGIPSIMCGFAIIFAVSLSTGVLPNYFKKSFKDKIFSINNLIKSGRK